MLGFTAFRTFARESGPVTPFRVQRPNTARMGRSKTSFGKREREKKREKKREEKQRKKEERKANPGSGDLDSMIAYVDEYGNIVDTPPDPAEREEIDAERAKGERRFGGRSTSKRSWLDRFRRKRG